MSPLHAITSECPDLGIMIPSHHLPRRICWKMALMAAEYRENGGSQ